MKEIWIEEELANGLKFTTRRLVRSRRKKPCNIDLTACIDKAVAIGTYGWTIVLSVATAAVLFNIWF